MGDDNSVLASDFFSLFHQPDYACEVHGKISDGKKFQAPLSIEGKIVCLKCVAEFMEKNGMCRVTKVD